MWRTTTGADLPGLDEAVVEAAPQRLAAFIEAVPLLTGQAEQSAADLSQFIEVAAVTSAVQGLAGLQLDHGRFIAAVNESNAVAVAVAVVGPAALAKLSRPQSPLDLGGLVRIGRYLFTVVGVLREGPNTAFDPVDFNNTILIPLASAAAPWVIRPAPEGVV